MTDLEVLAAALNAERQRADSLQVKFTARGRRIAELEADAAKHRQTLVATQVDAAALYRKLAKIHADSAPIA